MIDTALMLSAPLAAFLHEAAAGTPCRNTVVACVEDQTGRADILQLLGLQSLARGDPIRAAALLGRAAHCDAANVTILNNFGVALLATGNPRSAIQCLRKATLLNPGLALPRGNLGMALHALGEREEAADCLTSAIATAATRAPRIFRRRLADILIDQGRLEEAQISLSGMAAENPHDVDTMLALGRLLALRRKWRRAAHCFDRVLELRPGHADALCALAGVVDDDRIDALAAQLQVAATTADSVDAQSQVQEALALLAHLRRDVEGEDLHLRRALEYCPDSAETRVNLAKLTLLRGNFPGGWPAFEWRRRQAAAGKRPRLLQRPCWRGEELEEAGILLYAEQGFGSMLQYARYAPLVAARGGRVVLEVPGELVRLMRSLKGVERIIARGETLPAVAWQCPLMSLPLAFNTELHSIPSQVPYLSAAPDEVRHWSGRLPKRLRVGIAWSGAAAHYNDRRRSLPVDALKPWGALAPLGRDADIALISLHQHAPGDAPALPFEYFDVGSDLADFAVTAAIVSNLDLLISADTAVAHLAGALGKPVWILLPFAGEYRWLLDRDDSPWYPTARLFRQTVPGDWDGVLERVTSNLRRLAATGGA